PLVTSPDLMYKRILFLLLRFVNQPAEAVNPVMPNLTANCLALFCMISPLNV
ncbi:15023_t:CDS:1, partial [Funneliformis mosseae]